LLLAGVARLTQHAGQSRLLLTLTHAAGDQIKTLIANIRKGLDFILTTAPVAETRALARIGSLHRRPNHRSQAEKSAVSGLPPL